MRTLALDESRRERGAGPLGARRSTSGDDEQRVVRQLLEALMFERMVAYRVEPRGKYAACDAVFDLRIELALGALTLRCLGAVGAFDRVRIAPGSVVRVDGESSLRVADVVAAMDISLDARARLRGELEQTVTLCEWNSRALRHQRHPRRALGFQELESAIVEGHPYHPCFKARTGFSLQDHQSYGPEAGNTFQLEWLAIARSSVRCALPADERSFWSDELGASEYARLSERLWAHGRNWSSHALVPVHPWQLRTLSDSLVPASMLRLGAAGDHYQATQSLRTLVNASDPRKANIKLPLDVVCTSSRRNLEPNFVCTAPAMSAWLSALVAADPFLHGQRLSLLREYAGIIHDAEAGAAQGRLGVIFRESVCGKLEAGEAAVPFTALTLIESDGRPFIAEWVDAHGAQAWVERLLQVMLIPLWHMLVHHGVAFEAHPQNLILVHRDGWPERLVLRDLHQETEYVTDFLREPARVPDFAAIDPYFATVPDDDGYRMASTESLRELFMDCVYVYNLTDVSFLFARFFGMPEAQLWNEVRRQLADYARSGVTERARIARVACDSAEIIVESLLTKKVQGGALLDFYEHQIRNTLHG